MRPVRPVLVLFALAVLPFSPARAEVHFYLVDSIAEQATKPETRAQAHALEAIYADMEKQSGVEAKLVYSTDPDVNAFATEVGKDHEKVVVVQEGLLELMDNDRDAVAAVLGHELAHHKADHIRSGRKKQEGARVLGTLLGAVVGAKIGKGSGAIAGAVVGNAGGGLVALKFNRDQEMEADRLSVGWMIAAGYNPDGMLRLQKRLGEMEGHSKAAIFSTHPTSAKRYQAAQQQIAKAGAAPDLLQRPAAPLVGADALAQAKSEVQAIEDKRLAAVLKPDDGAVDAAALAPVGKVDFDRYAALENELQFAGTKGRAQLLARNHVTATQLTEMTAAFTQRMRASPALVERFKADYFRAAQGQFAAYGRDLADSYEKGQDLRLDPPYPLDTAAQLFAEMNRRGAPDLDAAAQAKAETEVLKAKGLSYYDFLIAHNWWSRKARIALVRGDGSVLRSYYSLAQDGASDDDADGSSDDDARAKAAAANVHIGNNVHVGNNVRVGGQAIKTKDGGGGN